MTPATSIVLPWILEWFSQLLYLRQGLRHFHATSWWRYQMGTFSALLVICAGNSPVTGEFPAQRPLTQSFDVYFDLRLNKQLSKQSWGWWFVTPSRSLWRHCNVIRVAHLSHNRLYTRLCDCCVCHYLTTNKELGVYSALWLLMPCC